MVCCLLLTLLPEKARSSKSIGGNEHKSRWHQQNHQIRYTYQTSVSVGHCHRPIRPLAIIISPHRHEETRPLFLESRDQDEPRATTTTTLSMIKGKANNRSAPGSISRSHSVVQTLFASSHPNHLTWGHLD
eukprot:scaffold1512_cov192-Alexandrium_tamarense.AAC.21